MRGRPLTPEQVSPQAVRRRFEHPGDWTPELRCDLRLGSEALREPTPAAVLIVLVRHPDRLDDGRLNVLLTQRARHLQAHAGQISFPGGRIEAGDPGPVQAALRETLEETGLPPGSIEPLGTLPNYLTVTRFDVTPVVGIIAAPLTLQLDAAEVEDAFEVPLSFLMDTRNHQRRVVSAGGRNRFVYTIPYQDGAQERMIWGVTAAIVRNFYAFLRG